MIDFNYTILVQFANFLILLIFLKLFLFNPVLRLINKREERVKTLYDAILSKTEEAESLEKIYEESLKEKKRPLIEEMEIELIESRKIASARIEQERSEILKQLFVFKEKIEADEKEILNKVRPTAEKLSKEVVERILRGK